MASRTLYSHLSDPPPTGLQFLEQYADRLGQLFTAAIWPLDSVGGTANAVTATCDPPLIAGLVQHMRFAITWAASNTSDMTLSVGGLTPVPVLAADGSAMVAGGAEAGSRALLEYVGSAFLVIGSSASGDGAGPYFTQITASGTWTKPGGYADDALVILEAWGAGAGGGRNQSGGTGLGGQGGIYARTELRYADVPSSLSVVIGAGGAGATSIANGSAGGSTSLGSLLTAPGGNGAGTSGAVFAGTLWKGATAAQDAVFGGAGGGTTVSGSTSAGGTSKLGGAGGVSGGNGLGTPGAGAAPGGGGGGSSAAGTNGVAGAAGARGEARIRIVG